MSIEILRVDGAEISALLDFACRPECGACCIAPSISSPIPDMPLGKPAGVRCVQLNALNQCQIFGLPTRPQVCLSLMPAFEMCGYVHADAFHYLEHLEEVTRP